MEWIVEGVTLVSTAALVAVATMIQPETAVSAAVYAVAIGTLVVRAIVSLFTGFGVADGDRALSSNQPAARVP